MKLNLDYGGKKCNVEIFYKDIEKCQVRIEHTLRLHFDEWLLMNGDPLDDPLPN